MKQYSAEVREVALRRILPPNNESLSHVSRDMGISIQTLFNWKKKASADESISLDTTDDSSDLSSDAKFQVVLATASMNETELGEYARSNGLFVEQINNWRNICRSANSNWGLECKRFNALLKEKDEENRQLKQELRKKDKALADLAAELMIRKKYQAIWGEEKAD